MHRAILLDVYGTLVHDDDEPLAAVCAEVARTSGVDAAALAAEWDARIWRLADGAFGAGFRSLRDLTLVSLAEAGAHLGVEIDAATVCADQVASWRRLPLFPDALPFLEALEAAGVPVCLVSDVDRADLDALLDHHRISVAAAVSSEEVRAYKPRPEPFRRALELLGLDASEVVHVGNSFTSDVLGAAALGIDTALVVRDSPPPASDPRLTYRLRALTDLLPQLGTRHPTTQRS